MVFLSNLPKDNFVNRKKTKKKMSNFYLFFIRDKNWSLQGWSCESGKSVEE